VKAVIAVLNLCVAACIAIALVGCDEPQVLTEKPISMDIYVDSTFSNDQVAEDCMGDVMAAVKLAAASRGFLEFHTFDGDPFRRRGLAKSFDQGVPPSVEGTSGELTYLEEEAVELEEQIQDLIDERPVVGGSPLIGVLERAARNAPDEKVHKRILICTDGLFTDVTPVRIDAEGARSEGERLGPNLEGVTVDFIGLDASEPGRGRRIEDTKPLVEALLGAAGLQMGVWNVELGSEWRTNAIAAAGGAA
jgi:hypothetical protein